LRVLHQAETCCQRVLAVHVALKRHVWMGCHNQTGIVLSSLVAKVILVTYKSDVQPEATDIHATVGGR
jgi:hypothetical protein